MKTDTDTLAVWLWKNERAALIRERGAQGIAARLARELAGHAAALRALDSMGDPRQCAELLGGILGRQSLVDLMLRDLCDCMQYTPVMPSGLAEKYLVIPDTRGDLADYLDDIAGDLRNARLIANTPYNIASIAGQYLAAVPAALRSLHKQACASERRQR